MASTDRSTPHRQDSIPDPSGCPWTAVGRRPPRGSSSCNECSGHRLETDTARRVISRSAWLSAMAERASCSATSVSVRVVDVATGSVIDRVTERRWTKRTLYGHRPSGQICLSEATGHSVGQVAERLADEFRSGLAASERGLGAHGFGPGRRLYGAGVDVGRERRQLGAGRLAEQPPQDRASGVGELADGMDTGLVEASLCAWARRPISVRWEGGRGRRAHLRGPPPPVRQAWPPATPPWPSVWCGPRQPTRADRSRPYPSAEGGRDFGRRAEKVDGTRDVEKSLVDRHPLDPRGEVMEYRHHLVAELLVAAEVTADEEEVAAELARPPAGHAGPDAVGPGLVGCRQHHAAAHGDGPFPQGRVQKLLDGRVEGVEVGVKDRRPARSRHHAFEASRTDVRSPAGDSYAGRAGSWPHPPARVTGSDPSDPLGTHRATWVVVAPSPTVGYHPWNVPAAVACWI